jgi:hypothetical protein
MQNLQVGPRAAERPASAKTTLTGLAPACGPHAAQNARDATELVDDWWMSAGGAPPETDETPALAGASRVAGAGFEPATFGL